MIPLKEIGEFLIAAGEKEYFFRPSFINMTRIGEPKDIVTAFYDLHHDEVSDLIRSAINAYGLVPEWLIQHIRTTSYGKKSNYGCNDGAFILLRHRRYPIDW